MQENIVLALKTIAGCGGVCALARAIFMISSMQTAMARQIGHDYDAQERAKDRYNWLIVFDGIFTRKVNITLQFNTSDGKLQTVSHHIKIDYGQEPNQTYHVWYHTDRPLRVTTVGPFNWFLISLVGFVFLFARYP
jgi:hypothetical protein